MLTPYARILILALSVAVAWLLPSFVVVPTRYRHSIDLHEYRSAYRSARWFGWQPGSVVTILMRLAIIGWGVMMAFPEYFHF